MKKARNKWANRQIVWEFIKFCLDIVLLTICSLHVFAHLIVGWLLSDLMDTRVEVKKLHFNWYNDYPNTIIELESLTIFDTPPTKEQGILLDTLLPNPVFLKSKHGLLRINIIKLLTTRERKWIESITLDTVEVNVHKNKQGIKNFNLFSSPPKPDKKKPDLIRLNEIVLRNVIFNYGSEKNNQSYVFTFDSIRSNLSILPQKMLISSAVYGESQYLKIRDLSLLEGLKIEVSSELVLDREKKDLHFKSVSIRTPAINLSVGGKLGLGKEKGSPTYFDLDFCSAAVVPDSLKRLIPKNYQSLLTGYESGGLITLEGQIVGTDSANLSPDLVVRLRWQEGKIIAKQNLIGLQKMSLALDFSTLAGGSLIVSPVRALLAGTPLKANLRLRNFVSPYLDFSFQADANLAEVAKMAGFEFLPGTAGGQIKADLLMRGPLDGIASKNSDSIIGFIGRGGIALKNIYCPILGVKGLFCKKLNGELKLKGRDILLENIDLSINDQRMQINGIVNNIPSVLLMGNYLSSQLNIYTDYFDIDTLVSAIQGSTRQQQKSSNPFDIITLPLTDLIKLGVKVNNLKLRQINFLNIGTQLSLKKQILNLDTLHFSVPGSIVRFSGKLDASIRNKNIISVNTYIQGNDWIRSIAYVSNQAIDGINDNFSGAGNIQATAIFEQKSQNDSLQKADIDIQILNVWLRGPNPHMRVDSFKCLLHLNREHLYHFSDTKFQVDFIEGKIDSAYKFFASLVIDNWNNRYTTLQLMADAPVETILSNFPKAKVENVSGNLSFEMEVRGSYTSFMKMDSLPYLSSSGKLVLEDIGFRFKKGNLSFSKIRGKLLFDDFSAQIKELSGFAGSSDFMLAGSFREILPYVLSPDKPLYGDLTYRSNRMNLSELLAAQPEKLKNTEVPTAYHFSLPESSDVNFNFFIDRAQYGRFDFLNIVLRARVHDQVAEIPEAKLNTWGGQVLMRGKIDARNPESIHLKAGLQINEIKIEKAFYSFEEFGQEFLTSDNIKGKFSAFISIEHTMPSTLKTDLQALKIRMDFTVSDGNLHDFKPLTMMSSFLAVERLRNPHFFIKGSGIQVSHRWIYIPKLEFKSSILNLKITGKHSMDDSLYYYIQLQRVTNPLLKSDNQMDKTNYSRSFFNFRLYGTFRKYFVRYDWAKAWQHLKSSK
jgi:hypothetical protein